MFLTLVWSTSQEEALKLPALCGCEENFSCINDEEACVASPTVQDFHAIEGELSREIVNVEDGGDPVLVVMAEYSLYVMTSSTIIEFEHDEQGLIDSPVPIRFFNFEVNAGAQATTSEAWDGRPTDWISVFSLPLEQEEEEGNPRRIRRLAVPPPGSCGALSIERNMCEVQDNGATLLANGCGNFVPLFSKNLHLFLRPF